MISHRTESRDTAPSRAQRLAQTGDVFFQTVRPYQRNNYLFAKPDNNYVFSTGYAQMRPKIDAEFLMCFLQTDSFVKVVLDNCTGTSYPAINSNDLSNLEISLPVSADEQREIGRFVTNLDNLITLHQRQYYYEKKQPYYIIYICVIKNIHLFFDFIFIIKTFSWEQRKFGEILDEFSNKSKTENEYPVLSSTNTGMEYRDGRVSGKSNIGYKIIDNNDLVLSPQNLWLGNININDIGLGIVSPSYKTFKLINVEPDFFRSQIRSTYLMNEYYNASIQGASVVRRNLDIDNFNDIAILVPSVSEQLTIGYFFRNLDNLITLHQRVYKEKIKC